MRILAVGLAIVLQVAAQDCQSPPPGGGGGGTTVDAMPKVPTLSAQRTLLATGTPATARLMLSDAAPRPGGGVIVAGLSDNADLGAGLVRLGTVYQTAAFVAAYDADLKLLWNRAVSRWPAGHGSLDMARVAVGADGSIVTTVKFRSTAMDFGGGARFCSKIGESVSVNTWCTAVVKYSATGQYLWDRIFSPQTSYGGMCDLEIGGVAVGGDGSVYIQGLLDDGNACDFGGGMREQNGSTTTVLLALTSLGVYKWDRQSVKGTVFPPIQHISGGAIDSPLSIGVTEAGTVVILGTYFGSGRDFGGGAFPAQAPGVEEHYIYLVGYKPDGSYAWGIQQVESNAFRDLAIKAAVRLAIKGNTVFAHMGDEIVARKGSSGSLLWKVPAAPGALATLGTAGVLLTTKCVAQSTDFGGGPRVCTPLRGTALVAYTAAGKYSWDKVLPRSESYNGFFCDSITVMNGPKRFFVMSSFAAHDFVRSTPITAVYDVGGGEFSALAGTWQDAYLARFDSAN